jgi:lysozyme family protein
MLKDVAGVDEGWAVPSPEAIDTIVRDFVRETKGKPFDSNALAERIVGGDRLAGVHAFEDGGGIIERVDQLRLLFAGDTGKMKTVENAWLTAVATKKVAADANVALMKEIPKYIFLIDGGGEAGSTLQSAQEVRRAALRIALANDVLIKMRDALNRIPVRQ